MPPPYEGLTKEGRSFGALYLCQMMFQLKLVEGGIPFRHLSGTNFSRTSWTLIHFLPSLGENAMNGVTSCHHHCAKPNNNWSSLPKVTLSWVCVCCLVTTCPSGHMHYRKQYPNWQNMSEPRRDKWHKIDIFLSLWTNYYQFGHFCQYFLSFITSWFGHVYVNLTTVSL